MRLVRFIQTVISLVFYAWTGQLGLKFTYWVVGVAGNLAVFVIPVVTLDRLGPEMNGWYIIHILASGAYFLFSAVCLARAAGNFKREKTWPF